MIKFFMESNISLISDRQYSISSSSSIFSDSSNLNDSENSISYYSPLEEQYPVQSVIENEAYCFDVEKFSEKLVDATFQEATNELSKSNSDFTVFDIVRPLLGSIIDRALGIDEQYLNPEVSEYNVEDYSPKNADQSTIVWSQISEFTIKLGQEQIEQYVDTWKRSSDWLFCIEFLGFESEDCSNVFVYEVEWSKPTWSYPIPQATASVYFALEVFKMVPYIHDRVIDVSYVFESSALIHKPGKIDFQERWLQNIIDEKLQIFKKMTFAVPAGICGPPMPLGTEEAWSSNIADLTCSKLQSKEKKSGKNK